MDVDDIPVRAEWLVSSVLAVAIKSLLWLAGLGAVLLVVLAVRSRPKHRR